MDILAQIAQNVPWSWIIGGLVLLALELVLPGGVLVWLGISAIVVGLATLVQPISWPMQWLLYGLLSLVSVLVWLNYARKRGDTPSDRPNLNNRSARLLGREAVLIDPITNGAGRISLDDGTWRVTGPELEAGTRVRIVRAEGTTLTVEAV